MAAEMLSVSFMKDDSDTMQLIISDNLPPIKIAPCDKHCEIKSAEIQTRGVRSIAQLALKWLLFSKK